MYDSIYFCPTLCRTYHNVDSTTEKCSVSNRLSVNKVSFRNDNHADTSSYSQFSYCLGYPSLG